MVADTAKRLLYLALGAMFVQQTFASIGRTLPLVIAPAIIEDLHIDPALVGVYVGAAALASLVVGLALFSRLPVLADLPRGGLLAIASPLALVLALWLFASGGNGAAAARRKPSR